MDIITLEQVKLYLKIDYEEDDALIQYSLIPASLEICSKLVEHDYKYYLDGELEMFKILVFATIQELYDHRNLTEVGKSGASSKIRILYSTIIDHLRYCR